MSNNKRALTSYLICISCYFLGKDVAGHTTPHLSRDHKGKGACGSRLLAYGPELVKSIEVSIWLGHMIRVWVFRNIFR